MSKITIKTVQNIIIHFALIWAMIVYFPKFQNFLIDNDLEFIAMFEYCGNMAKTSEG